MAWLANSGRNRAGRNVQSHDDPSAENLTVSEELYILTELEARKRHNSGDFERHLRRAMTELTPVLSHPRRSPGDVEEEMRLVFSMPEMQAFWEHWQPTRQARGPKSEAAQSAKAVMCSMAMLGGGAFVAQAYGDLQNMPALRQVFGDVQFAAEQSAGAATSEPFELKSYGQVCRMAKKLAEPDALEAVALSTKARMLRELQKLMPNEGIGRGFYIDGTLFPAWVKQRGRADEALDAALSDRVPWAAPRAITYSGGRKHQVASSSTVTGAQLGYTNFARGAYYVTVIEAATGWPLVSVVWPGDRFEALALDVLLEKLFKYFGASIAPDPWIAGDGAWDFQWAHYISEFKYGMAPIFRDILSDDTGSGIPVPHQRGAVTQMRSESGQLVDANGEPLIFERLERPAFADGAGPGNPVPGIPGTGDYEALCVQREKAFRARARVDDASGQRVSVAVMHDWRRLNAYPRYPDGRPDLYAFRVAAMMRLRNMIESHMARVKVGFKLATKGGDRPRIIDLNTCEALFTLAELRICAMSLADCRQQAGETIAPLPNGPATRVYVRQAGGSRMVVPRATRPSSGQPQDGHGADVESCAGLASAAGSRRAASSGAVPSAAVIADGETLSAQDEPVMLKSCVRQRGRLVAVEGNVLRVKFGG